MRSLIIPCGGKSSRFPNMRPKWLLTHPDGQLMIQKAINCMPLDFFDQIVIVILQEHVDKYNADIIIKQVFSNNEKIKICVLSGPTGSASETVATAIKTMNICGSITIKDSDNFVVCNLPASDVNMVVGLKLKPDIKVSNIQGKSFLKINNQQFIVDIVEKKIVSDIICLGVYQFSDAIEFVKIYETLRKDVIGELFISNIVSFALREKDNSFKFIEACQFQDWGTFNEWRSVQCAMRTYFVDFDGVLMKNSGRYGKINWNNNRQMLDNNCKRSAELSKSGGQIIITTSRPERYRDIIVESLRKYNIFPYAIIMGLNHSPRVLINDFAPTNPYPAASAINIPRNSDVSEYI